MTEDFTSDLRRLIERKQLVVVVGSGVSRATNDASPTWRSLIATGLSRCRTLGSPVTWCDTVAQQLREDSESDILLSAAQLVHGRLNKHPGEFARWMRDTFAGLVPIDRSVIEALHALDIPLLTTNYDGLIESVTGLRPVTWRDSPGVTRFVRSDDRRVLHLHGWWEDPDSVVLGIQSYDAVKNSDHTQSVMKALGITKSFVFVGCGSEGLADPNFGGFLTWLAASDTAANAEHRHYRLILASEDVKPEGNLYPLKYGVSHGELAPFLDSLRPAHEPSQTPAARPDTSPNQMPESVSAYLSRLAEATASLPLLGMGRSLQIELPIAEAYVPLRTRMVRSLQERAAGRFEEHRAEFEQDVELGSAFHEMARLGERGVVLLGEPGSGKTTGARQIAWRLASGASLPQDLGLPVGMIPVFLRFRNLGSAALAKKNGLRQWLVEETQSESGGGEPGNPGSDLWNGNAGALLWILDGLDEIADPEVRKNVSGWVRDALRDRPKDRFLVTCRFAGYFREGVPLGSKFVQFDVRPLSEPQVAQFANDWFGAAYRKLLGAGTSADERAKADALDLLEVLSRPENQTGHIRELSTNPLLLTILCIVFHEGRTLPTGRAELYAHCVRVLLEYWRRDLYSPDAGHALKPYNADAAQSVLARVAWWLHSVQDRTAAPLDDMAGEATKELAEVAEGSGLTRDGRVFLERMRDEAGIVAGEGDGRYGFLHLSFQEYLAADYATREGKAKDLAPLAGDSWWREVALLSLRRSRSYCEEFFRELLAAGLVETNADVAGRCLAESLYVTAAPFLEALSPTNPPARVAAVLRLLRDRAPQLPEVTERARALAETSKSSEVRGFAREILGLQGIAYKPDPDQRSVSVDQRTGLTFVDIPRTDKFRMGSEKGHPDERPVHRVRISQPFRLGKYPVTNAQYARFLESAGGSAKEPGYWDDRRFNQSEQPVVGVTWDEAQAFCKWAGGRLPTEAEWECACRAGSATEYYFGDDQSLLGEHAWYDANSGGQTQPVGAKQPNAWGLHDMLGNVWEWCGDWYGAEYYREKEDGIIIDPTGPKKKATIRVIRGGGWDDSAARCRSAYRYYGRPDDRLRYYGFRVAQVGGSGE